MIRLLHALRHRHERFRSALRVFAARCSGARIGAGCRVQPGCEVAPLRHGPRAGGVALGERCELERGVLLHPQGGHIRLGSRVFIGPYTVIYGHGGVEIGDDTLISMHCRILSSNHTLPPADRRIRWEPDRSLPTRIGHDVWLGGGVTVLGGVTIAEGCVVGAGAVVSHDLPPYAIAVGVPARITGYRDPASHSPA